MTGIGRKLREWLGANPANEYEVCLFTARLGGDPTRETAGRVVFRADAVECAEGVIAFYHHLNADEPPVAELVLVEDALFDEAEKDGAWVGSYANLAVPVDGFYSNVVVTVASVAATQAI